MTVIGSPKLFMITESRLSKGSVHVTISGTKINQTDEFHRVHVFDENYKKINPNFFFIGGLWKLEIQDFDSESEFQTQ